MRGLPVTRVVALGFAVSALLVAIAYPQSTIPPGPESAVPDWHRFRDKDGNEINARILSLSPDWRQIRIEREDGQRFDFRVTRLSLDDQQYLRTWLLAQQAPDARDLRFNLTLEKREGEREKSKLKSAISEATWQSCEFGYALSVTSLAKIPVANLKLEYYLLMEDAVNVARTPPEDEATPRWRTNRNRPVRYQHGIVSLPLLTFNRDHEVDTKMLVLDAISSERSGREQVEDRVVGVVVRLLTEKGDLITETSDLNRNYTHLDWETVLAMKDPGESEGNGILTKAVASN